MTLFDWLVLIVIGCSIIISVVRGLVKEILSLLVWIIAFVLANAYGAKMAEWLPQAIPGQMVRLLVGFLAVLILALLIGALVNRAIAALVEASGLKLADRGLGGLFGLARGIVIVLTLVILAGMTELPKQPVWRNALLSPLAETTVRIIKPWLPESVAKRISF